MVTDEPVGQTSLADRLRTRPGLPAACLLLALTVLAYYPALGGGFVFDDGMYLTEDARMASAAGLGHIWTEVAGSDYKHQYYPLTSTAFWLQHRLWGEHPFGYHFVNVLLHAINAVLLWRLLRALRVPWAWLAGAVFAVHPVHVQSVAWVSELKNVLSMMFFLMASLVFIRWLEVDGTMGRWDDERREDAHRRIRPSSHPPATVYALGLLLFICALLSKTATCVLPIALGLVVWWKRGRLVGRDLRALLPLVVAGAGFVLTTVYLESQYGGAQGGEYALTWLERALVAGRAVVFYAGKLAWPASLSFIYPRWDVDPGAWWQYLFPAAVLAALTAAFAARRRLGRGPATALAYFVIAVAPLSFVSVAFTRYSFVADHWQYWASIGLIALAASGFGHAWRMTPTRSTWWAAAATVVVAVLAGLTWRQTMVYESSKTLWSDTLAKNPEAWVAHNNLGNALSDEGRIDEAIAHYLESLRLHPDFVEAHCSLGAALHLQGRYAEAMHRHRRALALSPGYARAHYNMGNTLQALGRREEAAVSYRQAIAIDPAYYKAHNNLGTVLMELGDLDRAIACYRDAIEARTGYAEAHYNLGVALRRQGRLDEAIAAYTRAVEIDPSYGRAHNNLGSSLLAAGRPDEAVDHFRLALEADPGHAGANYNLGIALTALGDRDAALAHYLAAVEIDPDYAEAHNNLGAILLSRGYPLEAIEHYRKAIEVAPDYAAAQYNLGIALHAQGRIDESVDHLRHAVRLRPDHARAQYRLGAALMELGRTDEGSRHLEAAARLDPQLAMGSGE